jgi:hypothetical protein
MTDQNPRLSRLMTATGYTPLNRNWAKMEILFGLSAAGAALFFGQWHFSRHEEPDWVMVGAALVVFVLGGYLALAGTRSHLYQSSNEMTAFLLEEIHRSHEKG